MGVAGTLLLGSPPDLLHVRGVWERDHTRPVLWHYNVNIAHSVIVKSLSESWWFYNPLLRYRVSLSRFKRGPSRTKYFSHTWSSPCHRRPPPLVFINTSFRRLKCISYSICIECEGLGRLTIPQIMTNHHGAEFPVALCACRPLTCTLSIYVGLHVYIEQGF